MGGRRATHIPFLLEKLETLENTSRPEKALTGHPRGSVTDTTLQIGCDREVWAEVAASCSPEGTAAERPSTASPEGDAVPGAQVWEPACPCLGVGGEWPHVD